MASEQGLITARFRREPAVYDTNRFIRIWTLEGVGEAGPAGVAALELADGDLRLEFPYEDNGRLAAGYVLVGVEDASGRIVEPMHPEADGFLRALWGDERCEELGRATSERLVLRCDAKTLEVSGRLALMQSMLTDRGIPIDGVWAFEALALLVSASPHLAASPSARTLDASRTALLGSLALGSLFESSGEAATSVAKRCGLVLDRIGILGHSPVVSALLERDRQAVERDLEMLIDDLIADMTAREAIPAFRGGQVLDEGFRGSMPEAGEVEPSSAGSFRTSMPGFRDASAPTLRRDGVVDLSATGLLDRVVWRFEDGAVRVEAALPPEAAPSSCEHLLVSVADSTGPIALRRGMEVMPSQSVATALLPVPGGANQRDLVIVVGLWPGVGELSGPSITSRQARLRFRRELDESRRQNGGAFLGELLDGTSGSAGASKRDKALESSALVDRAIAMLRSDYESAAEAELAIDLDDPHAMTYTQLLALLNTIGNAAPVPALGDRLARRFRAEVVSGLR